jgi:hypothetical protein
MNLDERSLLEAPERAPDTMEEKKDEDSPGHHRAHSSLEDFKMLEIDFPTGVNNQEVTIQEHDPIESAVIPKAALVIVAEVEKLEAKGTLDESCASESEMFLASLPDYELTSTKLKVHNWDCKTMYSDFIKQGLEYNKLQPSSVIMLFESPSSCTTESSFYNANTFRFHDWPPPKTLHSKSILGPLRYSLMNGNTFPSYLRIGKAPDGLMEHWAEAIPGLPAPHFATKVTDEDTVYAYLPVEKIKNHINDPSVHYHLAGKDAIHLMTQKTTKLLPDTRTSRPCVVKTTHSMGSKGIFIINNDEDEAEFEQFLKEAGNPTFVVTDFVDIARNVACHFFIHPSGEVTWFGSNENHRLPDGHFSSDSYLIIDDQATLKKMQLPFGKCLDNEWCLRCPVRPSLTSCNDDGRSYRYMSPIGTDGWSRALLLLRPLLVLHRRDDTHSHIGFPYCSGGGRSVLHVARILGFLWN